MLNIFISSTYRDLKDPRNKILSKLKTSLEGIGMEEFIPSGETSQKIALDNLKKADIVIYILSSYYGSTFSKCEINDCQYKKNCEINEGNRISYTHCEFNFGKARNIPNAIYMINDNWDALEEMRCWERIDYRVVNNDKKFNGIRNNIKHYFNIKEEALNLRAKIDEMWKGYSYLSLDYGIDSIIKDITTNIIKWYIEGKIQPNGFFGRKKEIEILMDKLDKNEKMEIGGIGGVGKTTLVNFALLIQKQRGRRIYAIGPRQSYSSGSGYKVFREKCKENSTKLWTNKITLSDIFDSINVNEKDSFTKVEEKIKIIAEKLESENAILFIDDFQYADQEVKALITTLDTSVVIASKFKQNLFNNQMNLKGLECIDSINYIQNKASNLGKNIDSNTAEKISIITEGHPVSIDLILKNLDKINLKKTGDFKCGLKFLNQSDIEEFLKRLIKEILSEESYKLAEKLAVFNFNLDENLNFDLLKKVYYEDIDNFNQLIDSGIMEKKEDGIYRFSYKHIQELLNNYDINNHKQAIEYYMETLKNNIFQNKYNIELMYHRLKIGISKETVLGSLISLAQSLKENDFEINRINELFEEIVPFLEGENKSLALAEFARIYFELGNTCSSIENYLKSIHIIDEIHKKDKNNKRFLHGLAKTQGNLGALYYNIKDYENAELYLREAVKNYKEYLSRKDNVLEFIYNKILQEYKIVLDMLIHVEYEL